MVEMQASAPHAVRPEELRTALAEEQGFCKLGVVMEGDWWCGISDSGCDCLVVLSRNFAKFFSYHL